MRRSEILTSETKEYARLWTAQLYKADPEIVTLLRDLYSRFGVRAVSRALRQVKSERGYLRFQRRRVT